MPAKFKHPLYVSWRAMKQRCLNPNCDAYQRYGARGITVCAEWMAFSAFEAWAKSNGWRRGLTIDRIDVDKGYAPKNCRWATPKQQAENQRSACLVTINGVTRNVRDWSAATGIFITTLYKRYHAGVRGPAFIAEPRPRSKGARL